MQPASDRDLCEGELRQRAVLVVEEQLDLAVVGRGPVRGPGKEHVVRFSARSSLGASDPAAQISASAMFDLPEPFGPDHDGDARLEPDLDGSGNVLKPAQLDCTQVHARAG